MKRYRTILVAVDLGEYTGDLIERGLAVAESPDGVHVVYVQERMANVFYGIGPIGTELSEVRPAEDKLGRELEHRLQDWTGSLGVPKDNVHYLNGKPAEVLLDFAREHRVELIVIAKRKRKGLQRLLGSTANAVVQEATCDVLTVLTH